MTIEVLVSTMNQKDHSLLSRLNIKSPAVVINQCDDNSVVKFLYNGFQIIWVNTTQKGLSKSRNMALSYASKDVCLLADDDEILDDGYVEVINKAFEYEKKASIISFNIGRIRQRSNRKANTNRKSPYYKYYPSVSIAFKRLQIIKNGIHFNELIGAGSGYGSGEEALFLIDCRKNKLNIYECESRICTVDFSVSSWFAGYNEKYYRDLGVFLAIAYRESASVFGLYYLLQSRKVSSLKPLIVWKCIRKGIAEYWKI